LKFIKDTLTTFSTQIIGVILGLAAAIIIARVLGPSGKGAYTLIILVPMLLATFGTLGIGVANLYFVGKKKYKIADITSNSVVLASGLGILFAATFLAYFYYFHPSFLKGADPLCVVIATLVLPFSLLTAYFSSILLGEQKINKYNLIHLVQISSFLVFLLFFLFIERSVLSAIMAWVFATLVTTVTSVLLVRRLTPIGLLSFHFPLFKDSVKFGGQGYLGNVLSFLNYRLDMLLISFFMSVTFVGYYSVAVAFAETLWFFPGAVGTMMLARTPRLNSEEANESTPRVCRNTIFLTLLAAVLLFVFGKTIINLFFGASFLPALEPMWILLPGIVAVSINKVLCNELIGRGKPIIGTTAAAVSLVINIPLNIILIPMWGISGAAFASTVSYSVCSIVPLIAFMKISQNSLFDTIIIKPQDLKIYTSIFTNGKSFFISKFQRYFTKKI
jgi:O-antigen/teichoic acid export membrane protein